MTNYNILRHITRFYKLQQHSIEYNNFILMSSYRCLHITTTVVTIYYIKLCRTVQYSTILFGKKDYNHIQAFNIVTNSKN